MSSHNPTRRQGLLGGSAVVLAALLGLPLSGCFQPVYAPLAGGGNVSDELQAIAIDPIHDRIGHYLENELIFALNGTGSKVVPKYRLIVNLRENVQTPLLDTVTGYPSSATVVVTADYALTPSQGGNAIFRESATVVASYDRTSQRFTNIRASRDAEIRDSRLLAEQIRTNIAAFFAARG
ncbi:MAG: LPS assembly lipoprotein LptE [Methylocella sp.]